MSISIKQIAIGVALATFIFTLASLSAIARDTEGQKLTTLLAQADSEKKPFASRQVTPKIRPGKLMPITASAVSLTVDNVSASSAFLINHFGFHEKMSDGKGGFASLERKDCSINVIFLRRGIAVLPELFRHQRAAGVILAFTVKGLKSEERRLRDEGVKITMPLREEAWGERLFQVTDPNGIVIELIEWVAPTQAK